MAQTTTGYPETERELIDRRLRDLARRLEELSARR